MFKRIEQTRNSVIEWAALIAVSGSFFDHCSLTFANWRSERTGNNEIKINGKISEDKSWKHHHKIKSHVRHLALPTCENKGPNWWSKYANKSIVRKWTDPKAVNHLNHTCKHAKGQKGINCLTSRRSPLLISCSEILQNWRWSCAGWRGWSRTGSHWRRSGFRAGKAIHELTGGTWSSRLGPFNLQSWKGYIENWPFNPR